MADDPDKPDHPKPTKLKDNAQPELKPKEVARPDHAVRGSVGTIRPPGLTMGGSAPGAQRSPQSPTMEAYRQKRIEQAKEAAKRIRKLKERFNDHAKGGLGK